MMYKYGLYDRRTQDKRVVDKHPKKGSNEQGYRWTGWLHDMLAASHASGQYAVPGLHLDVDGIEPDIPEGAPATLTAPSFQSLLVEMDAEDTWRNDTIIEILGHAEVKLVQMGPISHQSRNGIFARR